MKILQINAVYNLSSTGRTQTEFQSYVNSKTSHECKTAFCYGGDKDDGFIIGSELDRKIHGLLSRIFGKQAWYSKNATRKLIKYIEEYNPDVIRLGNLHGNYINFPMLTKYIAKKDIPTVVVLHDCWPFTGKCCHYINDDCYKWQTGCHNCPRLKKDNKSLFLDRTKYLWNEKRKLWGSIPRLAVVGVSKWTAEESKKSPLLEKAKIFTYIYNGIDFNKFKPTDSNVREKYDLQNKKILLGVASIWSNGKGIDEIISLAKKLPDDCQIVLIGKASQDLSENNIINIPATNNVDELVEWYSAADVFINLSKAETFGKVSVEALACGTPVVCFNTTANPEIVGEGCGHVCESDSMEEYERLVMTALQNGKKFYSEGCVAFARENFDKNKNIEAFINLYEQMQKIK